MTDALILDMPVELGLEFMTVICTDFTDPERDLGDDVVDEGDGIGLGVAAIDLERPNAGGIIDGGVLVALGRLAVFSGECQELDVELDLVAGDLLLIALGVYLPNPCAPGEPVQAVVSVRSCKSGVGAEREVVIANLR